MYAAECLDTATVKTIFPKSNLFYANISLKKYNKYFAFYVVEKILTSFIKDIHKEKKKSHFPVRNLMLCFFPLPNDSFPKVKFMPKSGTEKSAFKVLQSSTFSLASVN